VHDGDCGDPRIHRLEEGCFVSRVSSQPIPPVGWYRHAPGWLAFLSVMLVVWCWWSPIDGTEIARGAALPMTAVMLILGLTARWIDRTPLGVSEAVLSIALLGLALWMTLATCQTIDVGNPRQAFNSLWWWWGVAGWVIGTRCMARMTAFVEAMPPVLLSGAAMLITVSLLQYAVLSPIDRAAYAADPDAILREAGFGAEAGPGTMLRKRFEDRLASTEPLATFALTNSLAGALLPLSILAIVGGWHRWREQDRSAPIDSANEAAKSKRTSSEVVGAVRWVPYAWFAIGFMALVVLVMTKSRTALVGWVAAMTCWGIAHAWRHRKNRERTERGTITGAVAVGVVVVMGVLVGGVYWFGDRLVLLEAPKSLAFRMQYWDASLRMLRDHPWWGVGPSNFQSVYAAYRVPEASELIADPHQWWLEVACAGGIPALVGFATIVAWVLWQGTRSGSKDIPQQVVTNQSSRGGAGAMIAAGWIRGGLWLGWWMPWIGGAWARGTDPISWLVGGGVMLGVWEGLQRWKKRSSMNVPMEGTYAALLALGFHGMGAGGLTVAGVAVVAWWLLATCGMQAASSYRATWPSKAIAVVLVLGLVATIGVGYLPAEADERLRARLQSQDRSMAISLREAQGLATEDRWSEIAASAWNDRAVEAMLGSNDALRRKELLEASEVWVATDRRSAAIGSALAERWLLVHARWGQAEDLATAQAYAKHAAERLPTGIAAWVQLAIIRAAQRDRTGFLQAAQEAARLDAITEHEDQRLINIDVMGLPEMAGVARLVPMKGSQALANCRRQWDVTEGVEGDAAAR
jgi:hypothetical protein